jgi:hypothetical protein
MGSEEELAQEYIKALDAYLRAQAEFQESRRDPVRVQHVEDARILLDVAKRQYFRTP